MINFCLQFQKEKEETLLCRHSSIIIKNRQFGQYEEQPEAAARVTFASETAVRHEQC